MVQFSKVPNLDPYTFLNRIFLKSARANKQKRGNYKKQGQEGCYHVRDFSNATGFAYIYINNQSGKTLDEKFRF